MQGFNCDSRFEQAEAEFAYLMSRPIVDPDRPKLRDRIPYSTERLHVKCRPFLTLGAEYVARETFRRQMENPPANVFPAWAKPNCQRKPKPFETRGCLPGMEAFYRQVVR